MDKTDRIVLAGLQQAIAHGDGIAQTAPKKIRIDAAALIEGPYPCDDARVWAVGRPAERLPVAGSHLDRRAAFRTAVHALNCAREHPGMASQQRFLFAG